MGQLVRGILLGCSRDAFGETELHSEHEDSGFLDKFKTTKAGSRVYSDEGGDVYGFWIAVDNGGSEQGCPQIGDEPIAIGGDPAIAGHKNAVKKWTKFAAWAAKQGVELPPPRLFFAQTEVA